jgi:uncharacterized protein with HEPN domain
VYLDDMMEAITNIDEFVGSMSGPEFELDKKTIHAVVRNLEVIGEAVKGVPSEIRAAHSQIHWQRIAGLRDILIHHYSAIDIEIVWDIVQNKLPELKRQIRAIQRESSEPTPS